MTGFPQVRRLGTAEAFRQRLADLAVELPFASSAGPALSEPCRLPGGLGAASNRFAVLPMEGWDGTDDGRPTELVRRRWRRFGESGAGLVWGGEAVAVRADGRANGRQLVIGPWVGDLRDELMAGATAAGHGEPVVGLQLTHSGRFSHAAALVAYEHPLLDRRRPGRVLSDGELDELVGAYVDAARVAADAGFAFVDIKACHGYLVHELLSAVDRSGPYGGDLDGRARFLLRAVEAVHAEVPSVEIGVRLSVFDLVPFRPGPAGVGEPEQTTAYRHAFGGDGTGVGIDLGEPVALVRWLQALGVGLVCVTAGSPYWCPHAQRPAYFPPSDGYSPPEDPLVGVARLVGAARQLKAAIPELVVVASGLSYLQEWLPHVAEGVVAEGWADIVGVGRMVLSYPALPADVLAGRALDRRHICRTFSDCTTAPRNGMVSGCWPLDEHYKAMPERRTLAAVKRAARAAMGADDGGDVDVDGDEEGNGS